MTMTRIRAGRALATTMVLAAGLAFGASAGTADTAAPTLRGPMTLAGDSLAGNPTLEYAPVYCGGWRRECTFRWGFRTPGYFRCLAIRGC